MANMTLAAMNAEVTTIIDRTDKSTAIDTRLQWALNEIADSYNWPELNIVEDITAVNSQVEYTLPTTLKHITSIRYIRPDSFLAVDDTGGDLTGWVDLETVTADNGATGIMHTATADSPEISLKIVPLTGFFVVDDAINGSVSSMTPDSITRYMDGESKYLEHMVTNVFNEEYPQPPQYNMGVVSAWTVENSKLRVCPAPYIGTSDTGTYILRCSGKGYPATLSGSVSSNLCEPLDQAIIYLAASMIFETIEEEQKAMLWKAKGEMLIKSIWAPYNTESLY